MNGRVDLIMTNPMKAHLKFLSKTEGTKYEFKGPVVDEEKYFGIGVGIGLRQGQERPVPGHRRHGTVISTLHIS